MNLRGRRFFTCHRCDTVYTPSGPTGDQFFCCGEKMRDSLRDMPPKCAAAVVIPEEEEKP